MSVIYNSNSNSNGEKKKLTMAIGEFLYSKFLGPEGRNNAKISLIDSSSQENVVNIERSNLISADGTIKKINIYKTHIDDY